MIRALLVLSALATPLHAQSAMTGDAFDRFTKGKTLFFSQGGEAYGAERYLDNRKVIWSFLDGECKNGVWYEDAGRICFLYEDRLDPQCWVFRQNEGSLIAEFSGDGQSQDQYEAHDIGEDLLCLGPDVGV